MSFKTKTILLLILVSLSPYAITMAILGSVYRGDVEERLLEDMNSQLDITIERLDQSLQALQNDMEFVASLDIMNDILTGDLDRRIFNVLLQKKQDLALAGEFLVINTGNTVVASTDINSMGSTFSAEAFLRVPLFSTFSAEPLGALLVVYDPANLTRYFTDNSNVDYLLSIDGVAQAPEAVAVDALRLEKALQSHPEISVRLALDRDFAFSALDNFNRSFVIALVIGMVVIASIAIVAANYILHPILLLSSTAREVTDTQDYSKRVTVGRSDEIGRLAIAFNSMISGMQAMLVRVKEENENRLKLVHEKNRAEMLQTLSNKLAKYLSPQIYQSIFSGEKDVTLTSSRKKLTIFFSDIVGFTSTTDQMESEDLTQLLNSYLSEMTAIALRYGATIDKYIGDAIMIFFGDPHSKGVAEDARLCVEMAIAMQKRVQELQEEWRAAGYTKPFSIRVGIHTGYCTVGNFGTESRMDYTIVGSSVNLASRIETSAEPGAIFISEDTYLLINKVFPCLPASTVIPKGFTQAVQLYQVVTDELVARITRLDLDGLHLEYRPEKLSAETRTQLQALVKQLRSES
jgi:class 3 adenylate cyclase/HAMP domain-containing protein